MHRRPQPPAPPGLRCHLPSFCLLAVLQNALVFLPRLRGKTVLCRSADKSFPLVTHWPTNALTPASSNHNRRLTRGSSPGPESVDSKDLVIQPSCDPFIRFYLSGMTSLPAWFYQIGVTVTVQVARVCPTSFSHYHSRVTFMTGPWALGGPAAPGSRGGQDYRGPIINQYVICKFALLNIKRLSASGS